MDLGAGVKFVLAGSVINSFGFDHVDLEPSIGIDLGNSGTLVEFKFIFGFFKWFIVEPFDPEGGVLLFTLFCSTIPFRMFNSSPSFYLYAVFVGLACIHLSGWSSTAILISGFSSWDHRIGFAASPHSLVGLLFPSDLWDIDFEVSYYVSIAISSLGPDVLYKLCVSRDMRWESH